MGKETDFAKFMLKQLRLIYKYSNKNAKWLPVIEAFEHYAHENILQRKRTIQRFITAVKSDMNVVDEDKNDVKNISDYYSDSVVMLKGVGPKVGYLFNKLGIDTVFDLVSFYPKKYIDYSSRCLIKHLKIGDSVTIYGTITNVKTYTTKNSLTIIKVVITDESASLELNFFYSKINRFNIERYKSQFPKGAGIIVSGIVKIDKFNNTLTIDKHMKTTLGKHTKTYNKRTGIDNGKRLLKLDNMNYEAKKIIKEQMSKKVTNIHGLLF
jgi:ATP-dependent DNA helicase RecG